MRKSSKRVVVQKMIIFSDQLSKFFFQNYELENIFHHVKKYEWRVVFSLTQIRVV